MEHNREGNAAGSYDPSPATVYAERLTQLNQLQAAEKHRERLFGYSKLATAAVTLLAALPLIRNVSVLLYLLAPIAVFVVLAVLQEKLLVSIRYRARAILFYERGLARLNGTWAQGGDGGERFLTPSHPYARDLDLFGEASLFEYLSTARTRTGEETLAKWLLRPAPIDEIASRQAAIRDIEPRLSFRERLWSTGETVRAGVHSEMLSAWGERAPVLSTIATRAATTILALLWIASLVYWATWDWPLPAILITVINFAYSHKLHARSENAVAGIEKASDDLKLLAEILVVLEQEHFSQGKSLDIQAAFKTDGVAPSAAIRRLARITDLIESRHSLFLRPLDLVTFWSAQLVFVAERWQCEFGPAIRAWLHAVGEFEALASLSGFAYEHPEYVMPEFVATGPLFEADVLAHPLLPADKAIANDVKLAANAQVMILSGPNMAGKSTFIRSIGVNAVLAQCGAPVRARRLRLSPLAVAASICILDSLAGGMSRFYAEIHRVKLITDLTREPIPVLFLLDELLSGTNSHDRLVGTQFVLRSLMEKNAIGIVSTHDLALTHIADAPDGRAFNCHFEDRLEDEQLIFDYKLKPGVVQTSNALKLMRAIGLGVNA
jgi:hypothetical protein